LRSTARDPVSDILRARALEEGAREAIVFLNDEDVPQSLTYADLDRRARAHATLFEAAARSRPNDGASGSANAPARVLLLYPPGLDYVAAFFGVLYAGMIPVPAFVPRNARQLPRVVAITKDCSPSVVATSASTSASLARLGGDALASMACVTSPDAIDEASLSSAHRPRTADPDACALLQYTSGATGTPKGVVVKHRNLAANLDAIRSAFRTNRESVGVIWLPPYHDMGLIGGVLQPIFTGFPVVLMSPVAFLQRPSRWLETIHRYRGSISGGPAFAFDLCIRKIAPDKRAELDLSSWKTAFCGAEPIAADSLGRFASAFESARFDARSWVPCYGLAEATLLVTGANTDAPPRHTEGPAHRSLVGCGPPAPETRVVIADPDTCRPCADDVEGESWIAGPGVASEYFDRPELSARAFGARLSDGDGPFFRTGDLGFLRDGELYVTGRLLEVIDRSGRKVHPHDVERTAETAHEALRPHAAAAFTASEGHMVLIHELNPGMKVDGEHVASAIRQAIDERHGLSFDVIALVKAGAIPVTSSGKLRRLDARASYEAGTLDLVHRSVAATARA
jgi:acyl-CoA synthetase (AMP-forming)/AMP-acid ligase II